MMMIECRRQCIIGRQLSNNGVYVDTLQSVLVVIV